MTLTSLVSSNPSQHRPSALRSLAPKMLCLVIGLVLAAGCGSKAEDPEKVTPPSPQSEPATNSTDSGPSGGMEMPKDGDIVPQAAPVKNQGGLEMPDEGASAGSAELKYASWSDVEKAAKSSGKVTVVDVWSTVCLPCIKELPGLAELHKTHRATVHCIAVDIDFDGRKSKPPETYEADVKKTLAATGVTCESYICKTPSDDVYAQAEIDSIPAVLVYDASGKLVKKFVDAGDSAGFGYEKDVVPFVKTLLK